MKLKRILSTALTVIMIFTAVIAVIPFTSVKSEAAKATTSNIGKSTLSLKEIETYVAEYLNYNFATPEEMLNHELSLGYLDYSTTANGMYTMYINRYTGFLFYRNNYTGQILTSNPTDIGYRKLADNTKYDIMSQISVRLYETADDSKVGVYTSTEWAALYGQISVEIISGGLRVNYTVGDTTERFLLPAMINATAFSEQIIYPIVEYFEEKFEEYIPGKAEKFKGNPQYDFTADRGYIDLNGVDAYRTAIKDILANHSKENPTEAAELQSIFQDFVNIASAYTVYDPEDTVTDETREKYNKAYPLYAEGTAVAVIDLDPDILPYTTQRTYSRIIANYCTEYTLEKMFEHEEESGYVHKAVPKPYVKCAIEYTFNDDGSLSVCIPSNSITFDESIYTLDYISPLKYFGAGNMTDDGFIFFPDGSGTVVEFTDFYNPATGKMLNISGAAESIFGIDYCYSSITGAHREQVTMPVYGLVGTTTPSKTTQDALAYRGIFDTDTVKSGYFAILEEGAPLAKLNFFSNVNAHKFGNIYASYNPYPKDKYEFKGVSVGSATSYTMVAKTKYSGSYVTRITMLHDALIGDAMYGDGNYCDTTYVGMANYYRNYLKENGTLELLETINEDLPLYVEALGSMTILTKVLTFPVEEEIPLTTFDDVITMYNEFANAKKRVKTLIDEYQKKALEEENELVKEEYISNVAKYKDLLTKIENVKNVNFRLTGFANDGMYYTYPTKASWQQVLGGKKAFQHLVNEGKRISKIEGQNLGIYPEFDFLYISNTALFDGISQSSAGARMVDNRYASKQLYNAILQEFETFYTMVVSSDKIDGLYTKFNEDYSQYGAEGLSVSTLGSDVNSNFDKDNSINRDEARENIVALLQRMNVIDGYDLMIDKGNIYATKYASHILNIATDSSHFKFSSYTVPFVGMILHGYVSYSGEPLNYSGSMNYEILRSIENGAAPQFILCYQNTSHMKEDEQLNKYYGVSYETWYDDILLTYSELNSQIGGLQNHEIVDHETVISERVQEDHEYKANYTKLEAEFFSLLEAEIDAKINAKYDELRADGDLRSKIVIVFSEKELTAQFRMITADTNFVFNKESFKVKYDELVARYTDEYVGSEDERYNVEIDIDGVENYESKYSFYTTSECQDDNYISTEYTLDNDKVVIVTYQRGDDVVRFILNYNIYTVNVRLDGVVYTLDKYDYVRIEG